MFKVAVKGMLGRKLRAALTATAIVLGVAMASGTFILTDTINGAFNSIFSQSYKNADVIVTGKTAFENINGNGVQAPTLPQTLLLKVQQLPDVRAAAGAVTDDQTKLVGRNGKVIGTGGAPNLGFSVDPDDTRFNPMQLVSGTWPRGSDQVAIDSGTASSKHYAVGDTIGVEAKGPVQDFRIAGIVKLPGVAIGGATIAVFDLATAQGLMQRIGQLDVIRVQAKTGVSTAKLLKEMQSVLPPTAQARDASAQVEEDKKTVSGFTTFIQSFLLAFAGIALFVGAFVIANTLGITIAQRTREFATLRTIGASRRQVLQSVIIESLIIGIVGSVVGLFLGLGLAKLLNGLFVAVGIDLPTAGTVFATRTVVVCLLLGTLITLFASLRPALRATRVAPIAAVREGAVLPPGRFARIAPIVSAVVLVVGILLLAYGVLGHGLATSARLFALGAGVLLLFFGVSANAARVVRPLASVLGWPATKFGGTAGVLARDNSKRNPKRTASTASALMIGLALVTFVAILGQGIRSSFESAVDQLFKGDYALTSTNTFIPLTTSAEAAVAKAPNITAVSGIRAGSARYFGSTNDLTAVDPSLSKVVNLEWKEGSTAVPAQLGKDGAFVDHKFAEDENLHVGSRFRLQTPTGKFLPLRIKGVYKIPQGGSPFASVTISNALFDANYIDPQNEMVFINTQGGVSDANTQTLDDSVSNFADAKIQTASEFKTSFEKPLNNIITLLYVLLALSVIVSLFGIVNTLILTIYERTRELGMLRAVGMTRWQIRSMIGYESVVTSLIGAALGMVVGVFLAVLVTHALSSEGVVFAVPWLSIFFFVLAAIAVGILAAIFPARRAARLNVLEALQYE